MDKCIYIAGLFVVKDFMLKCSLYKMYTDNC